MSSPRPAGSRAHVVSAHADKYLLEVFDQHGRTIAMTDATNDDLETAPAQDEQPPGL